jgi:hypothetical protein
MTTKVAWTPIAIERIDDIFDGHYPAKRKAKDLARLFQEHGLDITKPHEKEYQRESQQWLLRPTETGELITIDALQP